MTLRKQYYNQNYYLFIYVFIYLFIYPCKAEQPLQGMELQEKETQKD